MTEQRPELNDDWFEKADAYQGEKLVRKGTDTTDQQAVTVAHVDHMRASEIMKQFGYMGTKMQGGADYQYLLRELASHRLASVSSASAEPRKDTVAFVQDWLMNSDYDPTQFDKGFAAAIDARHGFDDAALTAIAERFCAAPLPDTVCADLVAIKPMAGRSGTNLMTVAEAKAVLRSIFPESVPATNQAGEVEIVSWLEAEQKRLDDEAGDYLMDTADCINVIREKFAALATQPATSQEGEGTLANPSTFGKPTFGLAATPTPTGTSKEADWVAVPRVPTEAMLKAGQAAADDHRWKWCGYGPREPGQGLDGMMFHVREAFTAMLAASPEPVPATNQAGEVERLRVALERIRDTRDNLVSSVTIQGMRNIAGLALLGEVLP